jgi:hypothetical protein
MWRAQILVAARGSHFVGHLTGDIPTPATKVDGKDVFVKDVKVPNLTFDEWFARDQQFMCFIFGSLTREVMSQVTAKEMKTELWSAIEAMFLSQNRVRAVNTRLTLATTKKGNQSTARYIGKMRALVYEMAATGRPL